ncbi:MAG: tRNA pseudouridine(13) synthase TruD [Anaerolineae bacterium]|nr:tRNA pseudouridine(13) synthase TruD [Anaerolineae bacterium]
MRIKRLYEDFRVEERLRFPSGDQRGAYAYYRIEKRGVPTTDVRNAMAAKLKVTPSALAFPALKDASAIAVQYASVRKRGPEEITGEGFIAQRIQWGRRALRPSDLLGNDFVVVLRDLEPHKASQVADILKVLEVQGLPNYYDEQRFGSLSEKEGFIGKAILTRDAEKVVRLYLSEPMLADPASIREFKSLVKTHWGQWGFLLHQAPRPSNFRSVITYLKDHPHEYRKAANLIQDRLLSIYLSAYQSWMWNHILATYLHYTLAISQEVEIAGSRFPLPDLDVDLESLQEMEIALPRLTANYEGLVGKAAQEVFDMEEMTIRDFKARILRRAYLAKGERRVLYAPGDVQVAAPMDDEQHPGRQAVTVSFTLQPGSYASLVLKTVAARLGVSFTSR